jgi:GDPmannose 4,6-dehydratase
MKRALIIGISGQDGTLLAKYLLDNNYEVYGTSRDFELTSFNGLKKLNLFDKVIIRSMILNDFRSVLKVINDIKPNEIYNLAGQTSVGYSFLQPVETIESIISGCLNVLESVKFLNLDCKIFNPCSSECYGESIGVSNELTPFNPLSPYAVAKTSSYWLTSNYRDTYGIYTCSAILSNHESFLRNERFVTMKIINSAKRIAEGDQKKLELGDVSIIRDWGCAEEYVKGIHLMLQQEKPEDLIISTSTSISLEEFVDYTFKKYNLDYKKHLIINESLKRPTDIKVSTLSNDKLLDKLKWKPKNNVYDVIDKLIDNIN